MPVARIKLVGKRDVERHPQPESRLHGRRRERRDGKRVLRAVAVYDPAHWPEPDYSHD
jgi:hypothetical protein